MNARSLPVLALLGLGLGGCAGGPPETSPDLDGVSVDAESSALVGPTARLYFGEAELVHVAAHGAPITLAFGARAGSAFELRATSRVAGAPLALTLRRVREWSGRTSVVGRVFGHGSAVLRYTGARDGAYTVELTAPAGTSAEVALDCPDGAPGACAPAGQPGELCAAVATPDVACDEGLFCAEVVGSCGRWDRMGSCKRVTRSCSFILRPVCGCDGRTYANACAADGAAVSVAHEGECAGR